MKKHHFPVELYQRDTHVIFDDFHYYTSTETWTSLVSDTNSSAADSDAAGGVLVINTGDNTDNNEAGVFTTQEVFKMAAGKPLMGEARIQYTEINTSAANVAFGFADAAGANLITDDGAAAAIANSGALIYKLDGGTVWRCYSKNGSDTTDSISTTTAGGSSYQVLRIEGNVVDGSIDEYELTFFVDGVQLTDSNNKKIKHLITYTSATEMDFGAYCKMGATDNTLTLNVDYLCAAQKR